eukprot:m51a1_g10120 hypothetical protein (600) ;mRNA; r:45762-53529
MNAKIVVFLAAAAAVASGARVYTNPSAGSDNVIPVSDGFATDLDILKKAKAKKAKPKDDTDDSADELPPQKDDEWQVSRAAELERWTFLLYKLIFNFVDCLDVLLSYINFPWKGEAGEASRGARSARGFDYASETCGAKIVSASGGVQGAASILEANRDRYLRAPCSAPLWVDVELCQPIRVESIALGNHELFSSTFRDVSFYGAFGRARAAEWALLGNFSAADVLETQTFELARPVWARYLRLVVRNHHRAERLCTLTSLSVYGSSLVEDLMNSDDWPDQPQPQPLPPQQQHRGGAVELAGASEIVLGGLFAVRRPLGGLANLSSAFDAARAWLAPETSSPALLVTPLFDPASDECPASSPAPGSGSGSGANASGPSASQRQQRRPSSTESEQQQQQQQQQQRQQQRSPQAVFSALAARVRRVEYNQSVLGALALQCARALEGADAGMRELALRYDSQRREVAELRERNERLARELWAAQAAADRSDRVVQQRLVELETELRSTFVVVALCALGVVVLVAGMCVYVVLDWNRGGPLASAISPRRSRRSPSSLDPLAPAVAVAASAAAAAATGGKKSPPAQSFRLQNPPLEVLKKIRRP